MKNPVPIGLTYVQLPHEKEHGNIWPWMIWENVSKNYSGVFFRVEGGEEAPFGEIQKENTTRVDRVNSAWSCDPGFDEAKDHLAPDGRHADIPSIGSSLYIETGRSDGDCIKWVSFKSSGGEIRPMNMAIKVWRRTS